MKVLITGPFGNVGHSLLRELSGRGHDVGASTCRHPPTERPAKRLGTANVVWGDIRDQPMSPRAVGGCDVVVHLAAIIPPGSVP